MKQKKYINYVNKIIAKKGYNKNQTQKDITSLSVSPLDSLSLPDASLLMLGGAVLPSVSYVMLSSFSFVVFLTYHNNKSIRNMLQK